MFNAKPPITTEAPTFTTSVPEIPTITTAAFNSVQLRVVDLEKDVTELKKVDHSTEILATIRSQVLAVVNEYLGSSLGDALHKYDLKHALFQSMNDSKSFIKHPTNQALYHALMEALITDEEAMDKGVADSLKQQKRPHDSSKNTSTTKETSKGKALTKGSKAGKSATVEETVEEPITELIMDDMDNIAAEEVVHDVEQPQDSSEPKKDNTPNWFTEPQRPPTPDPEWNTVQVVDDSPKEPWFNNLLSAKKDPLTFDALMATLIDFFKFAMN
ncbi:hypothetical protein Tco_0925441 [Tanacetum coccineum]|uniref:Uncharacterized protein n=1 Tax=Tanacetum coccineum TaxID=301880 RepID=A0ABQ5D7S1_9ASTR